jgi:hypothetical protein
MRRLSLSLCFLFLTTGCGPGSPPPEGIAPEPNTSAVEGESLKKMLEGIVNTGEAGSAAAGLRPSIEAINKANPGKGASLLTDLSQLESATHPDKVRELARKMLSKL